MQSVPVAHQRIRIGLVEVGVGLLMGVVALVINWKLLVDGLPAATYDLNGHLILLQHFARGVSAGIPYPRWFAETSYGYGSPTGMFYPPLVYYLGTGLKLAGLSTEQAVISLFCVGSWLAGLGGYLLGRDQWGRRAALVGAIAYMSNPYLIYDIYDRGALAEVWGLAWFPLGFFLTHQAIQYSRWRWTPALGFFLIGVTHLPGAVIYTLGWVYYVLNLRLLTGQKIKRHLMVSAPLGIGMAALTA